MIFKPSKLFPCDCMCEGLTVTPFSDSEDISEGEVVMSEDKELRDCCESPFIQLSFWEFGVCKNPRWNWWWRLKIAWRVFRDGSAWPDQVILKASVAKNLANHILYMIGKAQREMKLAEKQAPLSEFKMEVLPKETPTLLTSDLIQSKKYIDTGVEEPHPMFCVQHGGSPQCEKINKEHGFKCLKCCKDTLKEQLKQMDEK